MDDNSLRNIIKEEYKKCAQDAVYFFKKYGMIQHNIRGRINFNLYKFQERTLSELMLHDYNIILKSRQMGISTLTAAYALWMMLFNSDKNILVIATKQEVAKNIVDKVRFMFDNLPSWLKIECTEDNKLSLHLSNGSKIRAESSTSDSGRSAAVSMLIIDECLRFSSYIHIRNKKTGEIQKINIGNLYEQIR
jgi:phage terminase large subunit-like protein